MTFLWNIYTAILTRNPLINEIHNFNGIIPDEINVK